MLPIVVSIWHGMSHWYSLNIAQHTEAQGEIRKVHDRHSTRISRYRSNARQVAIDRLYISFIYSRQFRVKHRVFWPSSVSDFTFCWDCSKEIRVSDGCSLHNHHRPIDGTSEAPEITSDPVTRQRNAHSAYTGNCENFRPIDWLCLVVQQKHVLGVALNEVLSCILYLPGHGGIYPTS